MNVQLGGRTALVTGSTGGIGVGIARLHSCAPSPPSRRGRTASRADVVTELTAEGGQSTFVRAYLADGDGGGALADQARDAVGGRLDVPSQRRHAESTQRPHPTFPAPLITSPWRNVPAPFLLTGSSPRQMAERGLGRRVISGSIHGLVGNVACWASTYKSATKAALHSLTQYLAAEFRRTRRTRPTRRPGPHPPATTSYSQQTAVPVSSPASPPPMSTIYDS